MKFTRILLIFILKCFARSFIIVFTTGKDGRDGRDGTSSGKVGHLVVILLRIEVKCLLVINPK